MDDSNTSSQQAIKGILVSDFDGTITRFDFYDLVCRKYPKVSEGFWEAYERGEISHFEALRRIFAGIRAPVAELQQLIDSMRIQSGMAEVVARLADRGWRVVVASAGCQWYIDRLLGNEKVALEVHANPGRYSPETGLTLQLPKDSPFFSPDLGINKVAVVRDALKRSPLVAFAGDGRPDLPAALLVPPERRFARNWLAVKLREIGEGFQPFEQWGEVAESLLKMEGVQ